MYHRCLQISYNVYLRINSYFFPDENSEMVSDAPKKKEENSSVTPSVSSPTSASVSEAEANQVRMSINRRQHVSITIDDIDSLLSKTEAMEKADSFVNHGHPSLPPRSGKHVSLHPSITHGGVGARHRRSQTDGEDVNDSDIMSLLGPIPTRQSLNSFHSEKGTTVSGGTGPSGSRHTPLIPLITSPLVQQRKTSAGDVTLGMQRGAIYSTNSVVAPDANSSADPDKCVHNFVIDSNVKHCHICDKPVAHIRDPGYKCSKCKTCVHPSCKRKALGLPPKQKTVVTARELLLFRYLRINDIFIIVSAKGFPFLMELQKFEAHLATFKISRKLWAWEKLIAHLKKQFSGDVLRLAPSLVGRYILDNNWLTKKKDNRESSNINNKQIVELLSPEPGSSKPPSGNHSRNPSGDLSEMFIGAVASNPVTTIVAQDTGGGNTSSLATSPASLLTDEGVAIVTPSATTMLKKKGEKILSLFSR